MEGSQFIFSSGVWIGEGKITFSTSPNMLRFYTKWDIASPDKTGAIRCLQQVEMEGGQDRVFNEFICSEIHSEGFKILLNNEMLGKISGQGVIGPKTIAWEFRGNPEFEGFEIYELQENGDYMLHAEYASTDEFRTIVDGRIWKKSSSAT